MLTLPTGVKQCLVNYNICEYDVTRFDTLNVDLDPVDMNELVAYVRPPDADVMAWPGRSDYRKTETTKRIKWHR